MKSHHMEMDEKWAEKGGGVREWWELACTTSRHEQGGQRGEGREEVKDERRGIGERGIRIAT